MRHCGSRLFVLLLSAMPLYAQEIDIAATTKTITITEAVARAAANNLSFQGEELLLATRRQLSDTAFRAFFPQASLTGTAQFLNENPPTPGTPQNSLSIGISLALTVGYNSVARIKLVLLEYEAGKISYEQAYQDLDASVRSLFYTIVLLRERIAIGEESVRVIAERANDAQIRFDAGLIDEYTLLTAQVAVVNAQTPVDEARAQYREHLRQFNTLIGNDIDRPIELDGEIIADIFSLDDKRIVAELVPISPTVRSLEIGVDIARQNKALQISRFLPNLIFSYNFSRTFTQDLVDNFDQLTDTNSWVTGGGFTLQLAIPVGNLLPFSEVWVQSNAADRELKRAELILQESTQTVATAVYSSIDSLERIVQTIEAKRLNVERSERAFAVAQEGYAVGLRTILEVRDAQNQLDNARLDYLNERFNYIVEQIALNSQLGVDNDILKRYAR